MRARRGPPDPPAGAPHRAQGAISLGRAGDELLRRSAQTSRATQEPMELGARGYRPDFLGDHIVGGWIRAERSPSSTLRRPNPFIARGGGAHSRNGLVSLRVSDTRDVGLQPSCSVAAFCQTGVRPRGHPFSQHRVYGSSTSPSTAGCVRRARESRGRRARRLLAMELTVRAPSSRRLQRPRARATRVAARWGEDLRRA
jgi:hypothetical protein